MANVHSLFSYIFPVSAIRNLETVIFSIMGVLYIFARFFKSLLIFFIINIGYPLKKQ